MQASGAPAKGPALKQVDSFFLSLSLSLLQPPFSSSPNSQITYNFVFICLCKNWPPFAINKHLCTALILAHSLAHSLACLVNKNKIPLHFWAYAFCDSSQMRKGLGRKETFGESFSF